MSRPTTIGGIIVALLIGGATVYWLSQGSETTPEAEPLPAAAAVPTQVPAPAPASKPDAQVPFNRQHVRMSNVKVLTYPEKKDFSKLSVPEKVPDPTEEPPAE